MAFYFFFYALYLCNFPRTYNYDGYDIWNILRLILLSMQNLKLPTEIEIFQRNTKNISTTFTSFTQ
jgi:hypothetical protein